MEIACSADGTKIAYDRQGAGPALILVDGALQARSSGFKPELARLLSAHFTVYCYDRRGRGDSGDTQPYAVEREIEDIAALIDAAGGTACLHGHSSGACLAMDAAVALGGKVRKLAMYEPPYNDDPAFRRAWGQYLGQLTAALAACCCSDAICLFRALTGVPADKIEEMRKAPSWPAMEALAPTLAYDHAAILGDLSVPVRRAAHVAVPTLVMYGGASLPFMGETARALARVIPQVTLHTLAGQSHDVSPAQLAAVLTGFLTAG